MMPSGSNHLLLQLCQRYRLQLWLAVLILCALLIGAGYHLGRQGALEETLQNNRSFNRDVLTYIERVIERSRLLNYSLASSWEVRQLARIPTEEEAQGLSRRLSEIQNRAAVDVIYLMDRSGTVHAASNWNQAKSFVGKNYGFRPYFEQAAEGNEGQHIAIGVTSGTLGYYLAEPVLHDRDVIGVLTTKIGFDNLHERLVRNDTRQSRRALFLIDKQGAVFFSSIPLQPFNRLTTLHGNHVHKETEAVPAQQSLAAYCRSQYPSERSRSGLSLVAASDDQAYVVHCEQMASTGWVVGTLIPQSESRQVFLLNLGISITLSTILVGITLLLQTWARLRQRFQEVSRDALTNLFSRRHMMQTVPERLARRQQLGLILLDLDHFKEINDQYGHLAGDHVLQEHARIITSTIRQGDMAFRYGGEEFAIFLPNCPLEVAVEKAEEIRVKVEQLKLPKIDHDLLTISCGVTQSIADDNLHSLLERADLLLYRAKHEGRNRVCSGGKTQKVQSPVHPSRKRPADRKQRLDPKSQT